MYTIGYFILAIASVLDFALTFFMYIIIARAVLSWVSPDPYNPIVRFIHNITEPVLHRVRRSLPMAVGGVDLSPIAVILAIFFVQLFIVNSLERFSRSLI
ncbi:MAG: YggT family protein [Desulfobacterales bacterium]|nr:YggT family protein [Desulfobacterales bacterium]